MARPARPEQTQTARSSRQLSRFCYLINPDKVFGTHKRGAQGRDRTTDTAIFSRMLYQLSYLGTARRRGQGAPVYSQAGQPCPPCFASMSGIARRATTDGYA